MITTTSIVSELLNKLGVDAKSEKGQTFKVLTFKTLEILMLTGGMALEKDFTGQDGNPLPYKLGHKGLAYVAIKKTVERNNIKQLADTLNFKYNLKGTKKIQFKESIKKTAKSTDITEAKLRELAELKAKFKIN